MLKPLGVKLKQKMHTRRVKRVVPVLETEKKRNKDEFQN
jgi:hypothetical protein